MIDLIPIGPLVKQGLVTSAQNSLLAVVLGIAFGYVLQRSGFTDSRKMSGIFYLRDLDVPVVMFSAIITGMLGLWGLVGLGLIEPSKFYFIPTFVMPMVIGGFLMGIGMVTAGYCPGTAAAATAIGRLDGLAVLVGIIIGDLVFANYFELWSDFFFSTRLEESRIDQFFEIGVGSAIVLVIVFALAMITALRLLKRYFWGYRKTLCQLDRGLLATSLLLGVFFISGFTHLPDAMGTPNPAVSALKNDAEYYIIQIPGWNRGTPADKAY